MSTHAISSPRIATSPRRNAAPDTPVRAGGAVREGVLDFAGRSVQLDGGGIGCTTGWYFGVTPRRDATVLAVSARAWRAGEPDAPTQAHAAELIRRGVSVLIVDLRRTEFPWSAWIGCTRERVMEAAIGYLEDRGYDVDSIDVAHAA